MFTQNSLKIFGLFSGKKGVAFLKGRLIERRLTQLTIRQIPYQKL